ncbi:porin family protein [Rhizosphaericola mali]|uniref:PorT family protein n=1 Tax=Rhizosphaericola mali TaxID=2545455 RepID=A0A5P2FVK7_9BACT|nr:porin family protein [Rhizosphaericola mali]QES87534.1 PorT family protein [Rhizosphaericola mali]
MKKLFLLAVASVGLLSLQAQRFKGNTVTERTKIGIHGGMSVAYLSYGSGYDGYGNYYSNNSDALVGGTYGIDIEMPLKNGWYLQPEVNYTNMGGKDWNTQTDNNNNSYSFKYRDALNYLQVPILIKYKPMLQGFGIYFGPQYGYLLSAKEHYYDGSPSQNVKASSIKNEFALVLGFEYYFPSANDGPSFGLGLRGVAGLTNNVNKDYLYNNFSNVGNIPSTRNNGIYLTAGVRF